MTQTTPSPATPAEDEATEREPSLMRVGVLGTQVAYQIDCIWPQPPLQARAAQVAYDIITFDALIAAVDANPNATFEDRAKADEMRQQVTAARAEAEQLRGRIMDEGGAVAPTFATVGQIMIVDGDAERQIPAVVQVIGRPFGDWRDVSAQAPVSKIPLAQAVVEEVWPLERLVDYLKDLEEEEDDEEEEDETEEPGAEEGAAAIGVCTSIVNAIAAGSVQAATVNEVASVVLPESVWAEIVAGLQRLGDAKEAREAAAAEGE